MSIELIFRQSLYTSAKFLCIPVTYGKKILLKNDNQKYKRYLLHKWGFWKSGLGNLKDEIILIYAGSAGEFLNTRTFCQLIKSKYPKYKIALCTSGYDIDLDLDKYRLKMPWYDYVFMAPWDTSFAISRISRDFRIKILICFVLIIEHPLFLRKMKKAGVPTMLVNGLMSKGVESVGNNRCPSINSRRGFLMQYYKYYDLLGVQNEIDRDNFAKLGVDPQKIIVTGNMKFDINDINSCEEERKKTRSLLGFNDNHTILVAGSIHLNEEKLLSEAFLKISKVLPGFRLLIVPRFLEELGAMEKVLDSFSLSHIRKTEMISTQRKGNEFDSVVVDTFGELKQLYSISDYVYMGGSSQKKHPDAFGSHNIFEPLIYKKPIFFGPYLYLFKEITDILEKAWPGLRINTAEDVAKGIIYLQNNPDVRNAIYDRSSMIIEKNMKSVYRNLELVDHLLK